MSIEQKLSAVKEWLKFVETFMFTNGVEPGLGDWEVSLKNNALETAIEGIGAIAQSLLEDDFTREAGARILAEIEGSGL